MPIRGLDQNVFARLLNKIPFKVLEDTIIAIDGFWFLKKYFSVKGKEQQVDFEAELEAVLKGLLSLDKIQILWIWDGMDYSRATPRSAGLAKSPVDQEVFVEPSTRILRKHGARVIRAPYSAMTQCVYFLKEKYVRYIFTKTDALLFSGGNKIVTEFHFGEQLMDVLDRHRVYSTLKFNQCGFQAFSFLAGCELCPTVPCYASADKFSIQAIANLVRMNNLKETLVDFYCSTGKDKKDFEASDEAEYINAYYRAFMAVEYHPVMAANGRVVCLGQGEPPSDLTCIFGKPLPGFLFQQLFICNITPAILTKLARGQIFQHSHFNSLLRAVQNIFDANQTSGDWSLSSEDVSSEASSSGKSHKSQGLASDMVKSLLNINNQEHGNLNPLLQVTLASLSKGETKWASIPTLVSSQRDISSSNPMLVNFYMSNLEYIRLLSDFGVLVSQSFSLYNDMACNICFKDYFGAEKRARKRSFIIIPENNQAVSKGPIANINK